MMQWQKMEVCHPYPCSGQAHLLTVTGASTFEKLDGQHIVLVEPAAADELYIIRIDCGREISASR